MKKRRSLYGMHPEKWFKEMIDRLANKSVNKFSRLALLIYDVVGPNNLAISNLKDEVCELIDENFFFMPQKMNIFLDVWRVEDHTLIFLTKNVIWVLRIKSKIVMIGQNFNNSIGVIMLTFWTFYHYKLLFI